MDLFLLIFVLSALALFLIINTKILYHYEMPDDGPISLRVQLPVDLIIWTASLLSNYNNSEGDSALTCAPKSIALFLGGIWNYLRVQNAMFLVGTTMIFILHLSHTLRESGIERKDQTRICLSESHYFNPNENVNKEIFCACWTLKLATWHGSKSLKKWWTIEPIAKLWLGYCKNLLWSYCET